MLVSIGWKGKGVNNFWVFNCGSYMNSKGDLFCMWLWMKDYVNWYANKFDTRLRGFIRNGPWTEKLILSEEKTDNCLRQLI